MTKRQFLDKLKWGDFYPGLSGAASTFLINHFTKAIRREAANRRAARKGYLKALNPDRTPPLQPGGLRDKGWR